MNTYKGKNLEYLLVSSPVVAEFEMLVVACTINLLKGLLNSRFKTPLDAFKILIKSFKKFRKIIVYKIVLEDCYHMCRLIIYYIIDNLNVIKILASHIFHCYGRRTNRFLLLNYGFCLNNNKYNSLTFRVWINFDW